MLVLLQVPHAVFTFIVWKRGSGKRIVAAKVELIVVLLSLLCRCGVLKDPDNRPEVHLLTLLPITERVF